LGVYRAVRLQVRSSKCFWCRNGIDYFVMERIEREKLKRRLKQIEPPSFAASAWTSLASRLHAEVDAFVSDKSSFATKHCRSLLASPRYGERWARSGSTLLATPTPRATKRQSPELWLTAIGSQRLESQFAFRPFTLEQLAGIYCRIQPATRKLPRLSSQHHDQSEAGQTMRNFATSFGR
jgi:hypothetical protein